MLYIVSTPIGNLADITYRAIKTLGLVDTIACEDTRKSRILLQHYEIDKPLISFHSHSGKGKIDKIISELKQGKSYALISDAGTPGISDPWYVLIQEALKAEIEICPIPGVTAFTTALVGSGMQMNHFLYLGFMPVKKGRQTLFTSLVERKQSKSGWETVVVYESVHRIMKTLWEIESYFGSDHRLCVGRELTKMFEEFRRGTVWEVKKYYEENPGKLKGEFVICF